MAARRVKTPVYEAGLICHPLSYRWTQFSCHQKLGFSKKTAGIIAAAIIRRILAYTAPGNKGPAVMITDASWHSRGESLSYSGQRIGRTAPGQEWPGTTAPLWPTG
jgi:hypothetical protein